MSVTATELFTQSNLFRTRDLEEAREQVARVFCPHKLTTSSSSGTVNTVHNSVKLDKVSLNYLDYGAEVNIEPGELGSFFLVQIPLSGGSTVRCGKQEVFSDPEVASIPNPSENLQMTWREDSPHLLVHIPRTVLEEHLVEMTHCELTVPLRFDLGMNLKDPLALGWRQVLNLVTSSVEQEAHAFHESVERQLEDLLITGLLTSQNHNYSACINSRAQPSTPRSVRAVIDYCEGVTESVPTIGDLARIAGVSVRSLQESFKTHVGLTPTEYLREVRLRHVNRDLILADMESSSVSEIASRWGFTHLGRFSRMYADRFGELPSLTIRREPE